MSNLVVLFNVILAVVGLGLVVTFSPVLYAIELATLTRGKRPVYQTIILLASIAMPLVLLILLLVLTVNPAQPTPIEALAEHPPKLVTFPWVSALIGLACCMVGIGFFIASRHTSSPKLAHKTQALDKHSALFWFGVTKTVVSASGIAALFIAVKLIKQSSKDFAVQTLLVLLLLAAAMLPFVAFLLMHIHLPHRFRAVQKVSDKIASYRYYPAVAVVLCAIGVCFLISTLIHIIT